MTPEQKAIVEAQDAKLAIYNAKRQAELDVLEAKIARFEALAEEAERLAEEMAQIRQSVEQIEVDKELLLAA